MRRYEVASGDKHCVRVSRVEEGGKEKKERERVLGGAGVRVCQRVITCLSRV